MKNKGICVIAEIAGGHMGKVSRCKQLIEAASSSRADVVKFQFYNAEELCEKGHRDYTLFKELEFTEEQWEDLFVFARSKGLGVFADVFGQRSAAQAFKRGIDAVKLHPSDMDNVVLLKKIAQENVPVLLGIGGHKRVEIYRTIKFLRTISPEIDITLMIGHQLFPTPINEHSLAEIRFFSNVYRDLDIKVGVADHIDGDDKKAIFFPIAAMGAGAQMVEKHLTIDRMQKWEDYESAIEPKDFQQMTDILRSFDDVEAAFPIWTNGRQQYREKVIKTFFSEQSLLKGNVVSLEKLKFVRPKQYIDPLPSLFCDKKKVLNDIKANSFLEQESLVNNVGALISCRTASSRLPAKALKKICEKESIALLIERVKQCKGVNDIVLCTTTNKEDDVLETIALRENIKCFRGSEKDVALRLMMAAKENGLAHIVRITGDDLLRDITYIDIAIKEHLKNNADYTYMKGMVYSCDSEIISVRALETIVERATCKDNTEYLTWYLEDESAFVNCCLNVPEKYNRDYRLTLDTKEDLELFKKIYDRLYEEGKPIELLDVLDFLDKNPEISHINSIIKPKLNRDQIDTSLQI